MSNVTLHNDEFEKMVILSFQDALADFSFATVLISSFRAMIGKAGD